MESANSASCEPKTSLNTSSPFEEDESKEFFRDQFEEILPRIQEQWPEVAKQTFTLKYQAYVKPRDRKY